MVYAASGFVILELVSIIAGPFGLPEWTIKFVFIILCIGLVIAPFIFCIQTDQDYCCNAYVQAGYLDGRLDLIPDDVTMGSEKKILKHGLVFRLTKKYDKSIINPFHFDTKMCHFGTNSNMCQNVLILQKHEQPQRKHLPSLF